MKENDAVFFQVMKKIHRKDHESFQVDLLHYPKGKNLFFCPHVPDIWFNCFNGFMIHIETQGIFGKYALYFTRRYDHAPARLKKLDGNAVIAARAKYLLILLICPGLKSF